MLSAKFCAISLHMLSRIERNPVTAMSEGKWNIIYSSKYISEIYYNIKLRA